MPYTLIKGEFHIHYPENPRSGPEPDGDTLKFKPDNRQLVESLPRPNRPARFTRTGITTIRFEGIDALETHFIVDGREYNQEKTLAIAARDTLLRESGFGNVEFFSDLPNKVSAVDNHPVRGYLLSNGLDTFGRVIAFAFVGDIDQVDGTSRFAEPTDIDGSLNASMLRQGQAYGAFYLSLPVILREHLRALVSTARASGLGLWQQATASVSQPATLNRVDQLEQLVIWPKLFRRLAAFFQEGNTSLSGLDRWLRADPVNRDDRILLPANELGNMHDLIDVSGDQIRLTQLPEDVVIVPDDFVLPVMPRPSTPIPVGDGSLRIVAALINPVGPERGNETVTILNSSKHDINLDEVTLADNAGRLPLEGTLAAGESRRVALAGSVRLNNTRDTITLLDSNERILDQVSYEKRQLPEEGHTMVF